MVDGVQRYYRCFSTGLLYVINSCATNEQKRYVLALKNITKKGDTSCVTKSRQKRLFARHLDKEKVDREDVNPT